MERLRIGALARRTGLTVRTLHHWEAEGLIAPAGRSKAGYRLYGEAEVERLLRVVGLRQLGLSLSEVRECLERPEGTLPRIVERQLTRLDAELMRQGQLRDRLALLAERLRTAERVSVDELLETLEAMKMFEKYFDEGQRRQLAERREQVGPARIAEVEAEWPRLIAAVRAAMDGGTAVESAEAGALARRWMGLVAEFTGGDSGLATAVGNLYQGEPSVRQRTGLDPEIMAWVQRAWAAERARG